MKLSAAWILSSLAVSARAFVGPSASCPSALRMASGEPDVDEAVEGIPAAVATAVAEPLLPTNSKAIPFMSRPAALDGTLAGDVGFE